MTVTKGIDYAWWRPPSSQWLITNGYTFVCRYLSWLPNGKVLSKSEYDSLRAAGVKVCPNWEYDTNDYAGGYDAGARNGAEAYRQVRALGIDEPFVVYFSVDTGSPNMNTVKDYFRGIGSVMGGPDYVGIYGGYDTVKGVMEAGLAKYGWQTYAWSAGRWYAPAQVRQTNNGIISGNADLDYAQVDNFGYVGSLTPPQQDEDMAVLTQVQVPKGFTDSVVLNKSWAPGVLYLGTDFGSGIVRVAIHTAQSATPGWTSAVNYTVANTDGNHTDIDLPQGTDRVSIVRVAKDANDLGTIPIAASLYQPVY